MPRQKAPLATEDRTPLTRLREGGAHALVGYQLAQAAIVTNQVFDDQVGHARGGLRRVEFTILALVQANRDVTARQLARALAVTPPNIAIWLDKLESRGLVERSVQALLEGERIALDALSAAERAMLVELLHKVALSRRKPEKSP